MPPFSPDCLFELDGVVIGKRDDFVNHIISKDIRITPSQEAIDTAEAAEYGYSHPTEAINSVNKMLRERAGKKPVEGSEVVNEGLNNTKIVDENGRPQIVYHVTNAKFDEFKEGYSSEWANKHGIKRNGFYFTNNKEYANSIASQFTNGDGKLIEVHLDIKKPKIINPSFEKGVPDLQRARQYDEEVANLSKEKIDQLKSQGYDGIVYDNGREIIAFNADQIKKISKEQPQENIQPSPPQYSTFQEIPKEELAKSSKERKREQFDKKIDEGAKALINALSAKLPEGTKRGGVDLATVIQGGADIIKKAYHAGEDIAEAVGKAIDYIKGKWDKAWGEFDEATVADHLYEAGALSIDEEIESRFGLSPQEVLDIWNSANAGRDNPELLDFIQKLSGDEKKTIVKDALKGIVSDKLSKFIKVVKEKTGKKIDIMGYDELKKTVDDRIKEALQKEADKRAQTQKDIDEALKASQQSKSLLKEIGDSTTMERVRQVVKGAALMFHPAMFDGKELARDAMMLIRKEKGKEAIANERLDNASLHLMKAWNNVPRKDKIGFILSIENKGKYGAADPKFKEAADMYRERMDKVFDMISKIKDIPYLEDYFPHFWEKPEKARAHFASVYAKKPFEGSKSFLKQRFYADILEGLKAGLKLSTDNPEEMVRLAEMNALKFKTAHDIFHEMKERGLLQYHGNGEQPEGWKLVEDPLFKRMAVFTVKDEKGKEQGAIKPGGWYMPEPVARVVNNYLSRGLSGGGEVSRNVFQAVRAWNNFKNLFQLGAGLFHFTTTTIDSTVTGMANAVNKILSGKLSGVKDAVEAITILPNIARNIARGNRAIREYRTGEIAGEVQSMVDANARTGLSKIYTLDTAYNLQKSIGRLKNDWSSMTGREKVSESLKVALNSLMALPEAVSKPLMEWYVPRLKVGGYLRTLENELSIKKNLSETQILREKQRVWDDMDDRLGQMVYDNLFWNKTMKDLAFMTIRSFGWTGGTIRAFGKGIGELPESGKRLIKGEGISPRTAWLTMLPVTVGAYGAMYQYMMTGTGPDKLRDYFFPWDGTYNSDGTKHRVSLPSYMKDIFAYMKHPLETASHKTAPTFNEVIELFGNKDFYGTQIWNPKDPVYQQGLDILEYEGRSLIPFSFKEQPGQQPTDRQSIEQKFGIMPAVKEFQRTDTQNAIIQQVTKSYGDEVKTKADAERYTARREIRERLFKGEKWEQLPTELKQSADYSSATEREVRRDATLDPYKRMFRDLKSEQQLEVWSKMKPEEKDDYRQYLNRIKSFEDLHNQKPELFDEDMEKAYQEITSGGTKGGSHIRSGTMRSATIKPS